MFVESRPEIEACMDDMISSISERFAESGTAERLSSLKAILLGVSAVASSRGISTESPVSLSMLFDFRCRVGESFTDPDGLADLLAAEEVAQLSEEDQEFAGNVLDAIAL
jgi:hypothetical protein